MIAMLEGKVREISENSVIIFSGGVGFEVFVARPENFRISQTYTLYIYESIKENEISFYGFKDKSEKDLFSLVIKKVNGIGTRTAMGIFRAFSKDKFVSVIESGDYKAFKSVPGIGEKTAKRIVMELGGEIKEEKKKAESEKLKIVRSALLSLGYGQDEITKVLKDMDDSGTVEDLIKKAIKELSNGE